MMIRDQSGQTVIELIPVSVLAAVGILGFLRVTEIEWMRLKLAQVAFEDAHAKLLGRAERLLPKELDPWRHDLSEIASETKDGISTARTTWKPGKLEEKVELFALERTLAKNKK